MEGDRGSHEGVRVGDAQAIVAVPEPSAKALEYYAVRNVLWGADVAWTLAVLALFLWLGWSARIRELAQRLTRGRVRSTLAYIALYSLLAALLALPLDFVASYVVQHRFGLSDQTLVKWLSDYCIAFAVDTATAAGVAVVIYALLRRSPRRWWIHAALLALPFTFAVFIVDPVWVAPLFNKFGPMKDPALEAKIQALADRAGIEGARIYEVEKSVDTKAVNAYVAGLFATKRIVLWDTIIARLGQRQLLAVMGHEMGHYVLRHGQQDVAVAWLLAILSLYAAHRVCDGLIRRHRARFGFDRLDDVASWPLLWLVFTVVMLVTQPLFNAFYRHQEHEADRFALEITRDNRAAAEAMVGLQVSNLAVPRPNAILHILRDTHPSLAERIDFANTYRPWASGRPLAYGDKFH